MEDNISMKEAPVVGVDIGGSHITAGLVDMSTGSVQKDSLVRKAVDPHAEAAAILDTWSAVIAQAARQGSQAAYEVGIAMPGPFDYGQGISYIKGFHKYESLYGMNVKEALAERLAIPAAAIRLKNDAAAFLLGEVAFGAAKGHAKAVGLTLGTGLGSARLAGNDTMPCAVNVSPLYQGRAEDYISIRWFLHRYQELTGGQAPHVQYIAARAGAEQAAAQVFSEFAVNLATVLQRFIGEEQPGVVVLGGGIANAFHLFDPLLRQQLGTAIPIRRSALGEAAALAGAACGCLPEKFTITPFNQHNQL